MRKHLMFVAAISAVSLALVGAGCGQGAADQAKNTFTSIHDAIDRSIALRCEYTDTSGEKTIANISGKQIRLDSDKASEQGNFHGIIKDNKMYIWADKAPEGMMIDFSQIKDDSLKMDDKPIRSSDDIISKLEEKKDTCKATTAAASMFELPSDVKFTSATEPTALTATSTKTTAPTSAPATTSTTK